MKIGGYQILDVYNYTFTVGTGVKVDGSYKLIKAMRGKPINTSRIKIGAVTYDAAYLAFIPDGTSYKATFGDKTITIAADDTITFTNGIIGGGGTQVQADWTEDDPTDPSYIQNKPTLAEVATSGDYDDLENKPTIPAAQVQSDWNETDIDDPSYIKNKPSIPRGIPTGGTASQVLTKDSASDYDVSWTTPSGSADLYDPVVIDRIVATLPSAGQTTYFSPTTGEVTSTIANNLRSMSQGDNLITRNLILEIGAVMFYFGVASIKCLSSRNYEIAGSGIGIESGSTPIGYAIRLGTEFSIAASGAVITFGAGNSYITNLS